MNRIYQGRVSKVEILHGKNADGQLLENWQSVLWQHHELFQDAVNYYLLALLALARDPANPATAIRNRMADPASEHQIWTSFRRRGQTRRGLRDSVAKYIVSSKAEPTLEECFSAVLNGNTENPDVLDLALQELLVECDGDGAIQQEGRSMFPRFCSPTYKGDFPQSAAAKDKKSAKEWLPAFLYAQESITNLELVRQRLKFELFANRDLTGRVLDAVESRKRLNEMLDWLAERHTALAPEKERLQKFITALPDTFNLPAWRGGSVNKEALQQRFYAWLIFEHIEPSHITFAVLRDSFPTPKEKSKSISETIQVEKPSAELNDDPIKLARGARGYVFRAFTGLPCWGTDSPSLPAWKEFDVAAFKEALKALHQIESKGEERDKERERLLQRHAFMRGKVKTWKASPEQEEKEPDVLVGDPRIERLETLLKTELAGEYEMSEGETVEYGLQPRTIRGFRDLRKEWNKIVKPGEPFDAETKDALLASLRNYQKENPNIIGSVRLYEALVEKENWLVWQEADAGTVEKWAKQKFASDPLEALTDERQLLRDVERLKQPIKFTPADAVHSRRQFYFSDMTDLSVKKRFDAQKQTIEVPIAIKNDTNWKQQSVKIHFSAPRAVRDGLIDETNEDSQTAVGSNR